MSKFIENEAAPIVSTSLRQGFIPEYAEALSLIDQSENRNKVDAAMALGATGLSVASTCGILALSGATAPILIPIGAALGCLLTAWNSRQTEIDRIREAEFLSAFPQVLDLIEAKANGDNDAKVAAAYDQTFKAYRYGELDNVDRFISGSKATALKDIPIDDSSVQASATFTGEPQTPIELIQRLKQECPALYKLLKSPPIRLVGAQRTGKSTLAKILVMLRLACIKGHSALTAMPHDEDGAYPSVLHPVGNIGGSRDYASIKAHWLAYADRIERCQKSNVTTIWDEFGLFDKFLSEKQLRDVLTSSLRESAKHEEYPIFILHGETKAFMPGSAGLVEILKNSTVRVETIGKLVEGTDGLESMQPTGKFRVTFLDDEQVDGQLPPWLTEGYLLTVLSKIHLTPPPTIATPPDFDVDVFDRMVGKQPKDQPVYGLTSEADFKVTGDKPKPIKKAQSRSEDEAEILRYLRSVGVPKRVKEIRSGAKAPINKMSSSDIRELLSKMIESGTIKSDGTRFHCQQK